MKKTYLVELINHTSKRDNESATVSADNVDEAKEKASKHINRSQFSIGRIIDSKGTKRTTNEERRERNELKSICTQHWD
jgi:hypothetical protein